MRNKDEIQKELDKVKGQLWFIQMADRWTTADYENDAYLRNKKKELEEEMKRCLLREKNSYVPSAEANA